MSSSSKSTKTTAPDIILLGRVIRRRMTQVAFAVVLLTLGGTYWMIHAMAAQRWVVIMDPSKSYYVAAAEDLNTSRDLHAYQAALALEALFDRDPAGPDHPKRLELLLNKHALTEAKKLLSEQDAEYRSKQLHAKVEHGDIEILHVRDQTVRVSIQGQLIRTGIFRGRSISESMNVQAQFTFALNPNMLSNGRFPTVVTDFDYKLTPASGS